MTGEELQRLRELSSQHLDDSLTAQHLAELELMLEDKEALREFFSLMSLHSRLALVLGTSDSAVASFDTQVVSKVEHYSPDPATSLSRRWRSIRKPLFLVAALAACLWAILFMPVSNAEKSSFIARVVEKIDCNRESERWLTSSTAGIEAGEIINLDRGLIVIEFGKGARVTVEGPSQFEVVSANRGFLYAGKLTAVVPEQAVGFTVGTPSCDSVDLGTEFGLRVFDDGSAETHVFEGEVVLKNIAKQDAKTKEPYHLTTAMAARVEAGTHVVSKIDVEPAAFTRVGFEDKAPHATSAISNHISQSKQLVLWLDASRNVQVDENGGVSSWGDILYHDNATREDAWQVLPSKRPRLIKDGVGGEPTIRFDGKSHLVTAPIATSNEITVLCVYARHDHRIPKMKSAMLINFNGPPNLVLEYNRENRLTGRMYQGWANGVTRHGSWLTERDTALEEPRLAAYVYDYKGNRSELYINGRLASSGEASAPAAIHSSKFIGKNRDPKRGGYFVGDISEILIFNSAFSESDCVEASGYFLQKYGIDVSRSVETEGNEPRDQV